MHGLFGVFGASTTTLRMPSVLAVAAAAACVVLLGSRLAGPVASATLKGEEGAPGWIRGELLARSRVLLVSDAAKRPGIPSAQRDKAKAAVLREFFTVVEDREVRGRRVTLYGRSTAGPAAPAAGPAAPVPLPPSTRR